MQQRFAIIVVMLFLFAQGVSLGHMAENSFAEHQHHGKLCDIYLHAAHQNVDVAHVPPVVTVNPAALRVTATFADQPAQPHSFLEANPRGPPMVS